MTRLSILFALGLIFSCSQAKPDDEVRLRKVEFAMEPMQRGMSATRQE